MTISSTNRKAGPYPGNGIATKFPFAFKVFAPSDVVVVLTSPSGGETTLTLGAGYSIDLNADQDTAAGGTVALPAALASGYLLTITSDVQAQQPVDLTNQGGFYPRVINSALDRLTILVQQLAEKVGRAVKVGISSDVSPDRLVADLYANSLAAIASAETAFSASEAARQSAAEAAESAASIDPSTIKAADSAALDGHPADYFARAADAAQLATEVAKLRAEAMPGAFRNLRASAPGSSAVVSVSADALVVDDAAGNCRTLRNVALSINAAAVGVNGLDTGALAASTWYAVHVIYNPTTLAVAGLLSLSATVPTLPAGYTMVFRSGWVRTDGTANRYPLSFQQVGRRVQYKVSAGSNVAGLPVAALGAAGSITVPTWVAIALGSYVPTSASRVFGSLNQFSTNASAGAMLAPNQYYGAFGSSTNPAPVSVNGSSSATMVIPFDLTLESTSVYWANNSSSILVSILGWEDNL